MPSLCGYDRHCPGETKFRPVRFDFVSLWIVCVCVCVTVVSVCVIVPMPFGGQLRAADLRFTITGSGCSDEKSRRQLAGMGSVGLLMEISLDVSSRHRFRVLYVTRCGY